MAAIAIPTREILEKIFAGRKSAFLDTPHGNAFYDTLHGNAFYVGTQKTLHH